MKTDVLKEPIRIQGAHPVCAWLNASPFSEADLAPDSFYAAAGLAKDRIADRIRREMGERFPGVRPNVPENSDSSVIAYACLSVSSREERRLEAVWGGRSSAGEQRFFNI